MLLNEQIVVDCDPLVPLLQGELRDSVNYPDGIYGGEIEWNTPYAHYQYEGFLRTDENGRVFVGKNEEKPILTTTPLVQHEPGTTDHWVEIAKSHHLTDWLKLVKGTVGKG